MNGFLLSLSFPAALAEFPVRHPACCRSLLALLDLPLLPPLPVGRHSQPHAFTSQRCFATPCHSCIIPPPFALVLSGVREDTIPYPPPRTTLYTFLSSLLPTISSVVSPHAPSVPLFLQRPRMNIALKFVKFLSLRFPRIYGDV